MIFIRLVKAFGLGITILCLSSAFAAETARDIVLLVANSERMQTHDPQSLTRTAVTQFLQNLQVNTRVAIVTYDERILLVAPFTPMDDTNMNRLRKQLNAISPRGRHRNSAAGLERAIYELKTKGRGEAQKLVIFLNDGTIDTGDRSQDLDFAKWLREILAQEAAEAGIQIYGIAFTENADIQSVQTLAHKTSGSYYRAFAAEDINPAFVDIQSAIWGTAAQSSIPAPPRERTAPRHQPPAGVTDLSSDMTQAAKTDPRLETARSRSDTIAAPRTTSPSSAAAPEQLAPTPSSASPAERKNSAGYEFPTQYLLLALFIVLGLAGLGIVVFFIMRKPRAVRHDPPARQTSSGIYTPPGLLEDLNGVTGRESYDISGKLTWISRAHGEDSANVRTIVINDELISRDHAFIQYKNSGYWLLDRGSVNGTYVNGERITEEKLLKHGDQLRFARFEFKFLMPQRDDLAETVMARAVPQSRSSVNADMPGSTVASQTQSSTQSKVSSLPMGAGNHHADDADNTFHERAFNHEQANSAPRSGATDDTIITTSHPAEDRSEITQLSPSTDNHVVKGTEISQRTLGLGDLEENQADNRLVASEQKKEMHTAAESEDSAQRGDTEELGVDARVNIETSNIVPRDNPAQQLQDRGDTEELSLKDIDRTIINPSPEKDDDERTVVAPTKSPNLETSADQSRNPPAGDADKTVVRPIDK